MGKKELIFREMIPHSYTSISMGLLFTCFKRNLLQFSDLGLNKVGSTSYSLDLLLVATLGCFNVESSIGSTT